MAEKGVLERATPWPPSTAGAYLSRREFVGDFSSLPNAVYPALTTASLSTPLDAFHPTQMAYFNDPNNADFYSSVSGGFYSYPPPSQTFAIDTERTNGQTYTDPTDPWSMVRQSGPMVEPINLWATANSGERHSDPFIDSCLTCEPLESVAPTTSYTSRTDGYSWPSYDRSANYRQAQSHYSGYLSRGGPFASETSNAAHIPSRSEYPLEGFGAHGSQTIPLDYWGTNQSGASTSASYVVGVRFQSSSPHPADTFPQGSVNTHWPTTGPTRAEITRAGRYQPYGVSRTRQNWYGNAEAGPSTLVAPPVPYVDLPPTQPSGGISETTANANTNQSTTEEHRATVSHFYCSHIPRVTEWLFGVRNRSGAGFPAAKEKYAPLVCRVGQLVAGCVAGCGAGGAGTRPQLSIRLWLVSRYFISNHPPDRIGYNAVAAEITRRKRDLVDPKPGLKTGHVAQRIPVDSKSAKRESKRRKVERRLYRRLSLYFQPPNGEKSEWTRPPLLVKGKHGIVTHRTNNI